MYIIKNNCCFVDVDGRPRKGYFIGYDEHGMRNYGHRNEAVQFETKKDAANFLKNQLGNRPDHQIIRL